MNELIPESLELQNDWFKYVGINRPKEEYVKEILRAISKVGTEQQIKLGACTIEDVIKFTNDRKWWGLLENGVLIAVLSGEDLTPQDFAYESIPLNQEKNYKTICLSITENVA